MKTLEDYRTQEIKSLNVIRNTKKIIPCKKDQLVEMVLDIEKYPEFVPWCIEGKIFDKNESSDLITFNGDLKVGKVF